MRLDDSYTELTQWDTGRKIILEDSESCDQVHFSNKTFGRTIDMKTYRILRDNLLVADIPDELLRSPSPLTAYCYAMRDDGETTEIIKEFHVRPRNKPYNYIYNPNDQMRIKKFEDFVDDTMNEMNGIKTDVDESVEEMNEIKSHIDATVVHQPKIQNGTWWVWDFDSNDYVDTGIEAQGPQGIQGEKGDQGIQGEKGEPAVINGVNTLEIKAGTNINIEQNGSELLIDNTQQILMDFPNYIVTDRTMQDLLDSLDENNLPTGNVYLGGITCSDLPEGLMQAELKIEAIKNSDDLSVYYFTITSTDVSPYLWTGTGFRSFSGWQPRPTVDDVPTKTSDLTNDTNFVSETKVESEYVKNTAAATSTKLGLVKVADTSGIELEEDGAICVNAATEEEIDAKTETCRPIVPATLDYAVKSVTTDEVKADETAPVSSKAVKAELDKKTDKSTTLEGYGIEDAYTKTEVDSKVSRVYRPCGSKTVKAINELSNQEIGDVYNCLDNGELTPILSDDATLTFVYYGDDDSVFEYSGQKTPQKGWFVMADLSGGCYVKSYDIEMKHIHFDGKTTSITETEFTNGDVVNIYGFNNVITTVSEGDNVAWTENGWDKLAATIDLSGYIQKTDIVNDVTSDDTDKPLSAAQGKYLNSRAAAMDTLIEGLTASKQDKLTFDTEPTEDSVNPVTSGGAKTALDKCVKATDYAEAGKAGIIKVSSKFGLIASASDGMAMIAKATNAEIDARTDSYKPIVPSNLNYAVRAVPYFNIKTSVTDNTLLLSHREETRLTNADVTALTLTMPTTINDDYECSFSFKSGATATTLTYSSTPIIWKGADCDSDGDFIPMPNTIYEVGIKHIGNDSEGSPIIVARVGVC